MMQHSDQVGFAMIRSDDPQPLRSINADTSFGLASVHKVLILIAYAAAVAAGALDPKEPVSVADVERWYWPGTDGGAHENALADWHDRSVIRGSGGRATVPLDEVAAAMIRWSDNAATDYMLRAVGGSQRVLAAARRFGFRGTLAPPSIFGTFVEWAEDADGWLSASPQVQVSLAEAAAARTSASQARTLQLPSLDSQTRLASDTFEATPLQMVLLMRDIESEVYAGTDVGRVLSRILEWPMAFPSNTSRFEAFGTKGGSLPGIVTEASYFETLDGARYAMVLFFRGLSAEEQTTLLTKYAHQGFMTSTAADRDTLGVLCSTIGS